MYAIYCDAMAAQITRIRTVVYLDSIALELSLSNFFHQQVIEKEENKIKLNNHTIQHNETKSIDSLCQF